MRVLILGLGVVGTATKSLLEENPKTEIVCYDPNVSSCCNPDAIKLGQKYDAAFICVNAENVDGYQNTIVLEKCVRQASELAPHVFIRTTVTPGYTDDMNCEMKAEIYHFPEYLRESRGYESTFDLPVVSSCRDLDLMTTLFPKRDVKLYPAVYCEFSKYVQNGFFALKVNFFNGVFKACQANGIDYKILMKVVFATAGITGSISKESTRVPGPDGKFGFGGKCLPKDAEALGFMFKDQNAELSQLMYLTLQQNDKYRGERTW